MIQHENVVVAGLKVFDTSEQSADNSSAVENLVPGKAHIPLVLCQVCQGVEIKIVQKSNLTTLSFLPSPI